MFYNVFYLQISVFNIYAFDLKSDTLPIRHQPINGRFYQVLVFWLTPGSLRRPNFMKFELLSFHKF